MGSVSAKKNACRSLLFHGTIVRAESRQDPGWKPARTEHDSGLWSWGYCNCNEIMTCTVLMGCREESWRPCKADATWCYHGSENATDTSEGLIGRGKPRSALILQSLDCVYPQQLCAISSMLGLAWTPLLKVHRWGQNHKSLLKPSSGKAGLSPSAQTKMEAQQSYLFIHTFCLCFNFTRDKNTCQNMLLLLLFWFLQI